MFKLIDPLKINEYIHKNRYYYTCLLFFSKFLPINNDIDINTFKDVININKLLHLLRCKMKRVYNKKIMDHHNKYYFLNYELLNYEKKGSGVLKHGSLMYQYKQEKFPIINNNYKIFDDLPKIVTDIIPSYVYPITDIFKNRSVYAEYIECFDIYIVFDIDIINTTRKERFDIIRNAHNLNNLFDGQDNFSLWFYKYE